VHSSGVDRAVEKQMRNWEIARAQRREAARRGGEVYDFVTIANIVGAGGNEVAGLVGEALKWPVFDRQLLSSMAGDDETRARLYHSIDERDVGWLESTFRAFMQEEFRKNDYFHRLIETALCIARQGSAVFVGRSADLILPRGKGLRVKLVASPERCAQNFARRNNVNLEHARAEVARIEAERRDFIRNHFHIDPYEPTRFDLIVNVERFETRQVVELILAAHKVRAGSHVP